MKSDRCGVGDRTVDDQHWYDNDMHVRESNVSTMENTNKIPALKFPEYKLLNCLLTVNWNVQGSYNFSSYNNNNKKVERCWNL